MTNREWVVYRAGIELGIDRKLTVAKDGKTWRWAAIDGEWAPPVARGVEPTADQAMAAATEWAKESGWLGEADDDDES